MGYTHYWTMPDDATYAEAWAQIVRDTQMIADAVSERGIVLGNWNGVGTPTIDNGTISFNGWASADEDYESFTLNAPGSGSSNFEFCKTGLRPYDLAVTAVLLRVHMLVPSFTISSDGGDDAWTEARELIAELFPTPVDWGGRTFGQLTPDERRQVTREAAGKLQEELNGLGQIQPGEFA